MTLNDNFTKQEKMLLKEKDNSAKEPSEDIAILPKDKMSISARTSSYTVNSDFLRSRK
jgi:hypothetical protein